MGIAVIPAPGGGVTQKVDIFTSTGTWTAPANCFAVEVFLVGGGGGGGAFRATTNTGGAGGGGGGTVILSRKLTVTPGTSYTVTIGAGGAGSVDSQVGALGNDSSFGSLLTAFGGGGGGTVGSAGNHVRPSVKGTSGGDCSNSGNGGGGGGAAIFYPPRFSSTTPFQPPIDSAQYSSISNRVQGGIASSLFSMAGFGIEGFGGGGQPGLVGLSQTLVWNKISVHGGGVGGVNNENGGNATANTGGGGGGASRDNSGQLNGGNGGSGYAVITYWS